MRDKGEKRNRGNSKGVQVVPKKDKQGYKQNRRNLVPIDSINKKEMKSESPVSVKLDWIQKDITEIKEKLERDYVTRQEFNPVKNVVYGMVSTMLLAVLGAIVALVIKQ